MDIDFKKLAPWNWFKNEQQEQQTASSLPVQRNDLPAASGPVSPSATASGNRPAVR